VKEVEKGTDKEPDDKVCFEKKGIGYGTPIYAFNNDACFIIVTIDIGITQ